MWCWWARGHLIELIEVQRQDGPCLDCWRNAVARWPHFATGALDAGFAYVYAEPMRLRDECLGALNLFANEPCELVEPNETLALAMADVATIGILHERFIRQHEEVSEQLQVAFNTRVVPEQAKGVVAEAARVDMGEAFALLRGCARNHNLLLSEVARRVIGGDLATELLAIRPGTRGIRPRWSFRRASVPSI